MTVASFAERLVKIRDVTIKLQLKEHYVLTVTFTP